MDRGWIKLWRKLLDSEIFQNENLLKVAIWALLKANHKEVWVPVKTGRGETIVHLRPGQLIFGRHTAAKELKMPPSSTRNRLQLLRNARFMDTQPNTHYSIGTIINWEVYQPDEIKEDNQEDNQRTTKGHRQEYIYMCEFFSVNHKQDEKYRQAYPTLDLMAQYREMAAWLESNPKKRKTKRGYPRFINSWLSRAAKEKRDSGDWRDRLKPL